MQRIVIGLGSMLAGLTLASSAPYKLGVHNAAAKTTASRSTAKASTSQHLRRRRLAGTIVSVRRTRLGLVLVDRRGRTLYLFEKDRGGHSSCFGACASVWPPLTTSGRPRASHGVLQAKLRTTSRSARVLQVTYNGHPLYYYAGDSRVGQTNGEGLDQFGARWWTLSAAGRRVTR